MNTHGDLISEVIKHYEKCIEQLPTQYHKRNRFLIENNIGRGICYYIYTRYGYILSLEYVTEYTRIVSLRTYYCDISLNKEYEDAKKYLQMRIDRMKDLFEKWKNIEL